jgi:hypothetical protein
MSLMRNVAAAAAFRFRLGVNSCASGSKRVVIFKDVRCETRIHIKGFKRSLVKKIYLDELSTASLQSSTGRLK